MPVQPHLFPDSSAASSAANPHPQDGESAALPRSAPIWLQRLSLLILVVFCIYIGVIVTVLPWWKAVWDHNLFFLSRPRLWAVLQLGPVRGIISGFGVLDIWIGISEAIHYHDQRS